MNNRGQRGKRSIAGYLVTVICLIVAAGWFLLGDNTNTPQSDTDMTASYNDNYTVSSQEEYSDVSSEVNSEENDEPFGESASEAESENVQTDTAAEKEAAYRFANDGLLNDHFKKHNSEFGYANTQEYVEGANRVINDENSLHKLEADDGDDIYYLESTNEFVVVSTYGYIRTYFKPSRGIDYYNDQ